MPKQQPIEEIIIEEGQDDLSRHPQTTSPSTHPEWQHITPKPPPPASKLVASIKLDLYKEDVMSCFWAAVANNDLTDRMLTLTEEIILEINAAHYTVWAWRWKCLEALGGVALFPHLDAQERQLMFAVAASNAKNYQLWNHRRKYALARGKCGVKHVEEELEFSAGCLELDNKNYHAWSHRQAVIKQFIDSDGDYEIKPQQVGEVLEKELKYTDTLLETDVRNNSAWSQRAFLLPLLTAAAEEEEEEEGKGDSNDSSALSLEPVIKSEVEYTVDKINIASYNESAWNYLRYLAHFNSSSSHTMDGYHEYEEVALNVLDTRPWCSPALEFLADVHSERATILKKKENSQEEEGYVVTVNLATDLYKKLIKLNPVKAPYFRYRIERLAS